MQWTKLFAAAVPCSHCHVTTQRLQFRPGAFCHAEVLCPLSFRSRHVTSRNLYHIKYLSDSATLCKARQTCRFVTRAVMTADRSRGDDIFKEHVAHMLEFFAEQCGEDPASRQPSPQETAAAEWWAETELSFPGLGDLEAERLRSAEQLASTLTGSQLSRQEKLAACVALVQSARMKMASSKEYKELLNKFAEAEASGSDWRRASCKDMLVYGLGSVEHHAEYAAAWADSPPRGAEYLGKFFSASTVLWQLAFAFLLADKLPALQEGPIFYDPLFSEFDVELITQLGGCVSVVPADAEDPFEWHPVIVEGPTLFYMPHCVDVMYGAVLDANWNAGRLAQIMLIGNSFSIYAAMTNAALKATDLDPLAQTRMGLLVDAGACAEVLLPNMARIHTAGVTCLQSFPKKQLDLLIEMNCLQP